MITFTQFTRPPSKGEAARVLSNIEMGIYYGYPVCCIQEMALYALQITGCVPGLEIRTGERLCSGTGFVPCVECNLFKIRPRLEKEIAFVRLCPTPFPQEDGDPSQNPKFMELSQSNELLQTFIDRSRSDVRAWLEPLINAFMAKST